ncbi:magnesium-dependent phosphatase 1-like [Ischnura elegans]|uniref:magnesium-dependent phosphatase 1-like n=1 Tax=Ischnura elegans TaxID=197161 RepID=UPI001ED87ADE|nr:magnesium-dependent phosphatase 1-like [Ischnura elegans]
MGNERELKVIAFDLDYTLWPFRVDKESNPPFFQENGKVKDTKGKEYTLYPEVHQVLGKLFLEGYTLGVASRIENIEAADQLMKYFNLKNYFSYIFVYPGTKTNHFKDLRMHTGVEFKDMMFFDDDRRNIRDISRLGVMSVQVESGITLELLLKSIQEFMTQ